MGGARALLAGATLLLTARGAHGMYMLFSHYDLAGQGAAFAYAPVPYGRLGSYFPDAYKYMPYDRQPLYYDVRPGPAAKHILAVCSHRAAHRAAPRSPRRAPRGQRAQLLGPVPRRRLPAAGAHGPPQRALPCIWPHSTCAPRRACVPPPPPPDSHARADAPQ